jgi:hypothetical protein
MADWYCGSVQYTAVTQFAVSHAYSVGDIVRQLAAPSVGNERCFRCTTAGTSGGTEAAWNLTKAATTTQGTAVFTEVTGNSTYNWSAPHARLDPVVRSLYAAAGDRIFAAHNHAETSSSNVIIPSGSTSGSQTSPVFVYCVNASGSVPPVSADLRTTATVTATGAEVRLNAQGGVLYFNGIQFSAASFRVNSAAAGNFQEAVFENCLFTFTGGTFFLVGSTGTATTNIATLINTPIVFSAVGQAIYASGDFIWRDTASAIGAGTVPTILFNASSGTANIGGTNILLDGVDLSAVNTTLFGFPSNADANIIAQVINCRLHASATVAATPSKRRQSVQLVGSGSAGNSARNEKYDYDGTLTTETTIVRSSGASDGTTAVSWKAVTTANTNKSSQFGLPPIAIWNSTTGSSKTLTIEIVNDGTTLKDDEVWIEVEYLGSSSQPVSSKITSRAADHLTTGSNISTSSVTWTTTGLSSPVKQKMSVSFTPQMAGLVRAVVCIAKASQTLYVDPKVTIS